MLKDGMFAYDGFTPDIKLKSLEFEEKLLGCGIHSTFGFDRPSCQEG